MSLTSDELAGLPRGEQDRWRLELDPIALDSCGCRNAAQALAATSIPSVIAVLVRRADRTQTAAIGICSMLLASVVSKVTSHRRAAIREGHLRWALDVRRSEVAGCHLR
jgi:hypothetical protein